MSSEHDYVMVDWERSNGSKENAAEDAFVIHADLLIPGKGDPIEDASVVVKGGTIATVTTKATLQREFHDLPSRSVPVLMPGMWDSRKKLYRSDLFPF